jgi:hypothetical protein
MCAVTVMEACPIVFCSNRRSAPARRASDAQVWWKTLSGVRGRALVVTLWVGPMAADVDIEALGLLDGLEGRARAERAELIAWLLTTTSTLTRSADRSRRCRCPRIG